MKSLNFVIIGIPASINQESIVTAVALMAKKTMIENILKDVITVCTAAGLMNIAAINANFWKLIEDGKLTRPQIEMMLDEKEVTIEYLNKKECAYIFDLLVQAIRVL